MITQEQKKQVVKALREQREKFQSAARMAIALGINQAQLSRIMKGEYENVLSDANWVSIARKLDVQFFGNKTLITAETPTFQFINNQLSECKSKHISLLLCDVAGVGKTHAAKHFVKQNKNVVYIDCSQVKSKQKLIRKIAQEFGLNATGKYADVYEDLVFYLRSIVDPMVILDEAGDLDYPAFLELKALWNATEYCCGWYMMGADGLRAKIDSNLSHKKVGYAEIFRRYGERYQRVTPQGKEAMDEFLRQQVAFVCKANGLNNVQEMYARTGGSLTRLYIEIQKLKAQAA
jgi:DNA transposition AAA+ family ATPase